MKLIVLFITSLLLVGCSPKTPYTKIDAKFTQNVDLKIMHQAVYDAAKKESWDINHKSHQVDETHIKLSKVYQKRRHHSQKPILHKSYKKKTLYVNVLLTSKGFVLTLLDKRGNVLQPDHVENIVQMYLHSLKEAIYASLAEHLL
ncbi:MAG: hypothetical protein OEW60_03595 [Thiovulaceae bacterium]|nr:hypothetical protein [Sulfurimonadaceae bacterium]